MTSKANAKTIHVSASTVFKWGVITTIRDPIRTLAYLGVVPALWGLPVEMLRRQLLPSAPPTQVDKWYVAERAYWLVWCLWSAIPAGGCLAIGLSIVRGSRPSPDLFLARLRSAIPIALLQVTLVAIPLTILAAPIEYRADSALAWGQSTLWLLWGYTLMRSAYAFAIVVEQDPSLFAAIRRSWHLTRSNTWPVFVLLLLAVCFAIPALLWGKGSLVSYEMSCVLSAPLLTLAFSKLYVWRVSECVETTESTQGASP